jgi:hypothetical protein
LLTAERKNERERERGREKLWWKKRVGRARQITHFEKNNNAGHVFRVVFFHTWKNRHVDVLKNWHISNFTNEEGQSLNKITTTFFVETRADQIIHTFNEEQTKREPNVRKLNLRRKETEIETKNFKNVSPWESDFTNYNFIFTEVITIRGITLWNGRVEVKRWRRTETFHD